MAANMSAGGSNPVAERRLRPIWDAIDSNQYKQALKLLNSRLSKDPDSGYLTVLKALVLERMDKAEESFALCEQAKVSEPTDALTLSALQIVYHRLGCPEKATSCYELACSKAPQNSELMMGLFNCHVRDDSFLKQQQVALKMHKSFGEERFLLWAVCSIQLQVLCANKDRTLLSLAEALLKKRWEAHGFEELEAMLVYVSILEQANKYAAALAVLSSKSGDLFSIKVDKLKLEGKLLLLSEQYELAAKIFKEVLEISPDDWATYLLFLDAILEAGDAGMSEKNSIHSNGNPYISRLSRDEAENRLRFAKDFVESLQNLDKDEVKRGTFLAIVEIERRCLLLQLGGDNFRSFADTLQASVVNYFRKFGYLVSFASDIQGYLNLIPQSCRNSFLEQLQMACSEFEGESSIKYLQRRISLLQVQMQMIMETTPDRDLLSKALQITNLYAESLKLLKNLDPQESIWGEELITMAVTLLVQLFLRTGHPGYIFEAIVLLELGLSIRKYSFQYKILLVSLYSIIFCSSLAFQWYKTLDVKNILTETLSHHILLPLMRSMLWSDVEYLQSETLKFHKDYSKEAADLVIMAYRHCNYFKVLEFIQFKNRLQHSHHLLVMKIEGIFLRLQQKAEAPDEFVQYLEELDSGKELLEWGNDENLAALSFNEALETRPWWSPAPGQCILTGAAGRKQPSLHYNETKQQAFEREECWRRLVCKRCIAPRLLFLSVNAVRLKDEGDDTARAHADELKELVHKYAKCVAIPLEKLEEVLVDSSCIKALSETVAAEASDLVSLVLYWTSYKYMTQSNFNGLTNLIDMAKSYTDELTGFTNACDKKRWQLSHDDIVSSWSALPSLVLLVTEAFTWFGMCLQMWRQHLQPRGKMGKRKKKGPSISTSSDVSTIGGRMALLSELQVYGNRFCNLLTDLLGSLMRLLEVLEGNYSHVLQNYLDEGLCSISMPESAANPVPGLVFHSLKSSLKGESLGEMLEFAIQAVELNPVADKISASKCATLRKLSDVLRCILKSLQIGESLNPKVSADS